MIFPADTERHGHIHALWEYFLKWLAIYGIAVLAVPTAITGAILFQYLLSGSATSRTWIHVISLLAVLTCLVCNRIIYDIWWPRPVLAFAMAAALLPFLPVEHYPPADTARAIPAQSNILPKIESVTRQETLRSGAAIRTDAPTQAAFDLPFPPAAETKEDLIASLKRKLVLMPLIAQPSFSALAEEKLLAAEEKLSSESSSVAVQRTAAGHQTPLRLTLCGHEVSYNITISDAADQRFLGIWKDGVWSPGVCGGLIVERIDNDGDAKIQYIHGPLPGKQLPPFRSLATKAVIRDGKLSFTDEDGGRFVFQFEDGGYRLSAKFSGHAGTRLQTYFWKSARER